MLIDLADSRIPEFVASFPISDYYLSESAVREAVGSRFQFNLLHFESGTTVDFILPRDNPWASTQLERARRVRIQADLDGYVACPEDVVIGKLWYYDDGGSERHLRDIAGMVRVLGPNLDRAMIETWASTLGYSEWWHRVLALVDSRGKPQSDSPG